MNRTDISGRKPPDIKKGVIVFALTFTAMLLLPRHVHAQDASKVLKAMSDYLTGQNTISMTFDSDIEVITSELQKIQFTSSGQVMLNRSDKLRASAPAATPMLNSCSTARLLPCSENISMPSRKRMLPARSIS
jgi:Predicted periplasmic protein (DUF2092)